MEEAFRLLEKANRIVLAYNEQLRTLEEENLKLKAMLRSYQWTSMPGGETLCTHCYNNRYEGHKPDCELWELIKGE